MVSKVPSVIQTKGVLVLRNCCPNKTLDFLNPLEYKYLGVPNSFLVTHPTNLVSLSSIGITKPFQVSIPHPHFPNVSLLNPLSNIHSGTNPCLNGKANSGIIFSSSTKSSNRFISKLT